MDFNYSKVSLKKPLITRTDMICTNLVKENKTTFVKTLYKYLTLFTKILKLYTVSSVVTSIFLKIILIFNMTK